MEIGLLRRTKGRLDPNEKEGRIKNNLCLYCGDASHQLAKCPSLPKRCAYLALPNWQNCLQFITIQLHTTGGVITIQGLIDSGAAASFIDQKFFDKYGITPKIKKDPYALHVIDDRPVESGHVTKEVTLTLSIGVILKEPRLM